MEISILVITVINFIFLFLSLAALTYFLYRAERKQTERDRAIAEGMANWMKGFAKQLEERDSMFATAIKDMYEETQKNIDSLESLNYHMERLLSQRNLLGLEDYVGRRG